MPQKIALITGGTRGIGKAIAVELAKKNVRLILTYANDEESAKQARKELKATVIQVDLSDYKGANKVLDNIKKLDYLFLNVGITDRTSFGEIKIEEWDKVFRTNLTVPFYMIQELRNSINENGRIVLTTSISGIIPDSTSISYGVSKSAENMLVQYLAKEFASKKITVNAIAPGYTMTNWHEKKPKSQIKRIAEKTLLKRFATPEEIANVAKMIIENDYITGQIIRCDGGFGLC